MSTRGFIGFVVDGAEKIAYNHSDSYPACLGESVLTWLRLVAAAPEGVEHVTTQARELRVVDPGSRPTAEDVERLSEYTRLDVGSRSTDDWYCLLRDTQGRPGVILKAGYIEDASDFPCESLHCEWGYLVDLDERRFEVYEGFQRAPHDRGRFANCESVATSVGTYWPVALVASWPLDELPTEDAFHAAVQPADADNS